MNSSKKLSGFTWKMNSSESREDRSLPRVSLGRSGLKVSRLCFGTLPMSPLQVGLAPAEGAELLAGAFRRGINFWDTAELYSNYEQLRLAVKMIRELPVIATKTYAFSEEGARAALEKARHQLDLEVIPVFLLHEQESAQTLRGHNSALHYLLEAREKGLIQAVGISSHTIAAVEAAIDFPGLDVVHPLLNYRGLGIKDGTLQEMLHAVKRAAAQGLGIYAMKVLGGGHLIQEAPRALRFVADLPFVHAYAIGMSCPEEVEANLALAGGRLPEPSLQDALKRRKRAILIEDWCSGCGKCLASCPQEALFLEQEGLRVKVDTSRCITCGYCGAACPEFCIKII